MKLKPQQLAHHIQRQGLAPLYLLTGDEPLQQMEAADTIRQAARAQGYTERTLFHVEARFDWRAFSAETNALSLFASRRLLELRLGDKAPGQDGAKALLDYAMNPPPETLLLITAGRLPAAQQKSKWFSGLEKVGVVVPVYPIEVNQLPTWVQQRMQACGLNADAEVAGLIAERAEGHLLAAAQEIEKLHLLYGEQHIGIADVMEAVADSARFEVFGWVDTLLAADAARAVRQLEHLRAEGVEAALLISLLNRDLRALCQLAYAQTQGQLNDHLFSRHKIWGNRKALVRRALQQHNVHRWQQFLLASVELEKCLKGERQGKIWDELLRLGLDIAGQHLEPIRS